MKKLSFNSIFSSVSSILGRSGNGTARRKGAQTASERHSVAAEVLEVKQYPAATLTATLAGNGILRIEGTEAADRIIVRENAGRIAIDNLSIHTGGGRTTSVAASVVRAIDVSALGGNDVVVLAVPGQEVSRSARIDGGSGNDVLFGGNGSDQMLGGFGDDILAAGHGNDGLYGGSGVDQLYGGIGSDRFLFQAGDGVKDADRSDAVITFRNVTRAWSDSEIVAVDQGLALLHNRTGNTRLLKLSNGGGLTFQRLTVLPQHPQAPADNDSLGNIRFADIQFTINRAVTPSVVVHEIGHNWDEQRENPFVDSFRAQSGWISTPTGTTPLYRSNDGQWFYGQNATFARHYGRTNPFEDFATTIEVAFGMPTEQRIDGKLAIMNRFLDAVRNNVQFASSFPEGTSNGPTTWFPTIAYDRQIQNVVTINNASGNVMQYFLAWPGQSWQSYIVQPGRSLVHASADPEMRNLAPRIVFDQSAAAGYQANENLLVSKYYVQSPSEGWGSASQATDGFVYSFVVNSWRTGWLLQADTRIALSKRPFERRELTTSQMRSNFPHLGSHFEVLGAATGGGWNGVYNCLAWTSGNVRQWEWKPEMNHGGIGSIQSMDRLYASRGYVRASNADYSLQPGLQKIAIYWGYMPNLKVNGVTHGALQQADGTWTSKLGPLALIRHQTPQSLNGPSYGVPIAVYVRRTTYGWNSAGSFSGSVSADRSAAGTNSLINDIVRKPGTSGTLFPVSTSTNRALSSAITSSTLTLTAAIPTKDSGSRSSLTSTVRPSVAVTVGPLQPRPEVSVGIMASKVDLQAIDEVMSESFDWMLSA
jgi:hypothetical protein